MDEIRDLMSAATFEANFHAWELSRIHERRLAREDEGRRYSARAALMTEVEWRALVRRVIAARMNTR